MHDYSARGQAKLHGKCRALAGMWIFLRTWGTKVTLLFCQNKKKYATKQKAKFTSIFMITHSHLLLSSSYGLDVCAPPNPSVETLTPNVMVFWGGGLWEVIRLWGCGLVMGLMPSEEDTRELALSFSPCWGDCKKLAINKTRRKLSAEPNHDGTLFSDLQPPELWEINFLMFKPPSL